MSASCPRSGLAFSRRDVLGTGAAAGLTLTARACPAAARQATPAAVSAAGALDLSEIQGELLAPRPWNYSAAYLGLRIDDPAGGRAFLASRMIAAPSVTDLQADPSRPSVLFGFTWNGLKALGLPETVLSSFPAAFREGMASRAHLLGDTGPSAPDAWDAPFAREEVHLILSAFDGDRDRLEADIAWALADMSGVTQVWRQDLGILPTYRTHFGYRDNISQPAISGDGTAPLPGQEPPIAPGEFFFGYPNELGGITATPQPGELGRNGTFAAFRKLHTNVAAFRDYLSSQASSPEEEEMIAAKIVGRWRSGAPLVLAPDTDDEALARDPLRNNDFGYAAEDARGFRCPAGAHIRRVNPRDALLDHDIDPRQHRLLRRGATYGPLLPDGAPDDGEERGIAFMMFGADLERQFEFVKRAWMQDGVFAGLGDAVDPIAGQSPAPQTLVIPERPIRRQLKGLPQFVTTRAGCYAFVPSISGLRWLASYAS
jgi:Dyp-type peroxidase family